MMQMQKMCDRYCVDTFRDRLNGSIEEAALDHMYESQGKRRVIEEVLDLVTKMTDHHQDSLD